jgi:hypothetical protein
MVRYKVKPDRGIGNENLIRKVFEELQQKTPAGLRYASFKMDDGLSFVHIASIETDDGNNPLSQSTAFQAFQEEIRDRCEEPPVAVDLNEIGNYGFFG